MEEWVKVGVIILVPAVGAVIGWIWALWQRHNDHKLHVAENYVRQDSLEKSLRSIFTELRFLRTLTIKMAARMQVPAVYNSEADDDSH